MKNKIVLSLLLLMGMWPVQAAQTFRGQVSAPDGRALEGVILSVSGVRSSALTDASGAFLLETEAEKGTVTLTCDGYYPRELQLSALPSHIVMVPRDEFRYDGLVVLPSGTQTRDRASALLETQSRKSFKESPSATLAWQDVSPALQVSRKSGMPGEGAYLNIRGLHSLNAENTPLMVINGVPYLANTNTSDVISAYSRDMLAGYNAHDIRSITVLTSAEAAAYGSLGSNGVIFIETEQATSDNLETRIRFSGNYGMATAQRSIPVMDVDGFRPYLTEVGQTRYSSLAALQKDYPFLQSSDYYESYLFDNQTEWSSLIYDRALVSDNVLRVEGGDEVAKYNISFGYTRENGVLDQTDVNRYHTSMNSNIMVSPDFQISTSVNLAYINSDLNNMGMNGEINPVLSAYHMMPNLSPYEKLSNGGMINRYLRYNGWNTNPNPSFAYDNVSNPLAIVRTVDASDKIYDANILVGLNWQVSSYWHLNALVNIYYDYTEEYSFVPGVTDMAIIPQLYDTGNNHVSMGVVRQNAYYYHLSAAWNRSFRQIHSFSADGGLRLMTKSFEYDAGDGYNSANDFYKSLSKVADEWGLIGDNDDWKWLSLYAHGDYVYDNLLKTTLSLNLDGTTASGADAPRFGLFPALSFTYMAANTGRLGEKVDHLNLTADFSLSGNSRFSSNFGKNYYVSNNLFNLGTIVRNGVPNTNLEWEKKAQADLGVDLSMFGNRLGLRAAAYYAHHYDLLLDSRIAAVYGSNEAYYDNTAAIRNAGAELSLRVNPVRTSDFDWNLTFNTSYLHSRIASLGGDDSFVQSYTAFGGDDAQTLLKVGKEPYTFFGYETAGVYATTEEAQRPLAYTGKPLLNTYGHYYQGGDVIFVDQNQDGVINDKDRIGLGSAAPDFFGSLNSSLRYRSWTLLADFGFSLGNQAYNATRRQTESMDRFFNQATSTLNRWQIEGQQTDMPRAAYGDPSGNNFFSDRWVENASYLKLRRLTLSYRLPEHFLGLMGGQVWLSAENLWTLSAYLGGDPEFCYSYDEALRGFDYAKVTIPTTFKLGFNLNF